MKLGAEACRKPPLDNPQARVATGLVGGKNHHNGEAVSLFRPCALGLSPKTPTLETLVAPPASINGKIHDEADCTGGQELQVISSGFGHTDNNDLASPALVRGGRHYGAVHHHILYTNSSAGHV